MRKFTSIVLMVLLLIALIFGACAAPAPTPKPTPAPTPAPSPVKPIELRLGHPWAPTTSSGIMLAKWAQLLEERANGKLKVTIFPAGSLASAMETVEAIKSGLMDLGQWCTAYLPGQFPLNTVIQLSLPSVTGSTTASTIAAAYWELLESTPELQAEWKGMHILGVESTPPMQLMTKTPIRTLEEVKGKKFRAAGFPQTDIVVALGGVPVTVPYSAQYESLQKGLVDGTISTFQSIPDSKVDEVIANYTAVGLGATPMGIAMNPNVWNKLPDDIKKVFDELDGMKLAELSGSVYDADENKGIAIVKGKGQLIIYLSPEEKARWDKALSTVTDKWIADMGSKGLAGKPVVEKINDLVKKYSR